MNTAAGFLCVFFSFVLIQDGHTSHWGGYRFRDFLEELSPLHLRPYRTSTVTPKTVSCSAGYYRCPSNSTCILNSFICDGTTNCADGTDEIQCDVVKVADLVAEKRQCVQWFLDRRSNNTVNKWGLQVHRTAVALYLADKDFFAPENKTGEEIRYELVIHLLSIIKRREGLMTEQLALYVHAMLVSCLNPRDFYNHDLVSDLRKRVDTSNYTNPLAILVLCNAGANMTTVDVQRLSLAFFSQHRPFWTDIQVISTIALSCLSTKTSLSVDQNILKQWVEHVKLQFKNGTVNNPRTIALIIQMLLATGHSDGFNWQAAVRAVQVPPFSSSSSFLDRYYLIQVLSNKSQTAINSSHCTQRYDSGSFVRKLRERMTTVHYSVWMDKDIDYGRSWRLRMPTSSSLTDVIEKVHKMDSTHTVEYNMVDGKPYVRSVSGVDEDPETDHYWFTYERALGSTDDPTLLEESPVDISTRDDLELILWYRNGIWNSHSSGSGELS